MEYFHISEGNLSLRNCQNYESFKIFPYKARITEEYLENDSLKIVFYKYFTYMKVLEITLKVLTNAKILFRAFFSFLGPL